MFRMTASNNTSKRLLPLLSLPLPPPSQRLTNNLLPDAYTPTPASLVAAEGASPSLIRRARPVPQGAGFSYSSAMPIPFPYEFPAEEKEAGDQEQLSLGEKHRREQEEEENKELTPQQQMERQMREVEKVMSRYEIQPSELGKPAYPATSQDGLAGYLSPARRAQTYPSARLLALSPAALRDALPSLDVGDAFDFIRSTSGREGPDAYSSGAMAAEPKEDQARARFLLSDVLGGRAIPAVLPSDASQLDDMAGCGVWAKKNQESWKDEDLAQRWNRRKGELEQRQGQTTYAGWSNAYAGHQFGQWAGQLGDGRAVTLFETINESADPPERWEVQLKGAGRTPYSRFADGLATLGSSTREFLGSEAVAALGIPTSRALCVTSLPDVGVERERMNTAAITTRLAQSWIRVGSFQLPASRSDWEAVRLLGEYVARVLFRFEGIPQSQSSDSKREKWATKLLLETARRNAKMVAGWQASGHMNGVINTDNVSILGLTIDYGPYGFMDIFSPDVTPNHSDDSARYSYKMQPSMILFAMRQLHSALSPIIGFEDKHGRAPNPGELAAHEPHDLEELSELGEAIARADLEETFVTTTTDEWRRLFRRRLGLNAVEDDEKSTLLDPLLDTIEELDFSITLRKLSDLPPLLEEHLSNAENKESGIAKAVDAFLPTWYDEGKLVEYLRAHKRDTAKAWLKKYGERLERENGNSGSGWGQARRAEMLKANPRFILRNWVGEEVIRRLEQKNDTAFLERVLNMCLNPCRPWGEAEEGQEKSQEILEEEARLCEVGQPLSVNMPSCSS